MIRVPGIPTNLISQLLVFDEQGLISQERLEEIAQEVRDFCTRNDRTLVEAKGGRIRIYEKELGTRFLLFPGDAIHYMESTNDYVKVPAQVLRDHWTIIDGAREFKTDLSIKRVESAAEELARIARGEK